MDSIDDDFGDLYVDVEAQAASAVAGGAYSVRFPGESECGKDLDRIESPETRTSPLSEPEVKNLGVVTRGTSGGVTQIEEINDSDDSGSDDDLNIVLTDGDNENGGNNDVPADGVVASDNDSVLRPKTATGQCLMSDKAKFGGGMKMEASGKNVCIDQAQGMPEYGYSVVPPWCRNVFGSSIDLFEEKPWRKRGADITDFFNFGFNEQSWEDYCKSLRQHYTFTNEHAVAAEEPPATSCDGGSKPLVLLKGRAIEIQDRTIERIPSVDRRCPRDPDPDVVIQIPVDSSVGEVSGSTIEEPGAFGNDDDSKRMHSSVDSTEERASMDFQEGNTRFSSGEQSSLKEKRCGPEGTSCSKEGFDEEEKEVYGNSDDSDSYRAERESPPPDQFQFSPTPSYSMGKSEESDESDVESLKDSATDDQLEGYTPPRRTRLSECDTSEYEVREQNGIRDGERNGRKQPSCRRFHDVGERNGSKRARPRRSHEEQRKRHCGRPDYAVQKGMKLKNVKDSSSASDSDSGLNRERHYRRMHASMGRGRQRNRQHKFGYHSNKESLHPRAVERSTGYNYEREFGDYTGHSPFNHRRRKSLWSCIEEEDPYIQHHYESGYFHARSAFRDDENMRNRSRYDSRAEPFYVEKAPFTDRDHRFSPEYASDHKRHYHRRGQENDLHYRNRYDYDNNNLHRYDYEDEVHRERYGLPHESAHHERRSFGEPGRRKYPEYERDGEFSRRGEIHNYTPDWRVDGFDMEKAGYNYNRMNEDGPSFSLLLRESRYAKRARSDLWRDDMRKSKLNESYDGRKNQFYRAGERDDRTVRHGDVVDTGDRQDNDDVWAHPDRRFKLKNNTRDSTGDLTHHEHRLNTTDEMSVRYRRRSARDRISTKQRASHEKSHIHEEDTGRYRSKKIIEDGDFSASIRIDHEHALLKCQDSDDFATCKSGRRRHYNGVDTREHPSRDGPRRLSSRNGEKPMQLQESGIKEEGEIEDEQRNAKGTEIDEERIRESLKKMEKRRERFKEDEAKKRREATGEPKAAELRAETEETKQQQQQQQRPPRKRRWCAS